MNTVLVILILQLSYYGIGAVHQIHYDFGLPAFLVMGMLIFFDKLNYQYISIPKKIMLLASILLAFQFLDVMPAAGNLLTGRGEISVDIKLAGQIMGADTELNILSMAGCALFFLFSVITFLLLRDENNLRQLAALKEQNQAIRTKALLTETENRTYREMQHLVHDLKSPMTVIQTLTGVFKLECEAEQRQEDLELLSRVENAVDQMSQMISEILYEDKTSLTTVEKLIHRVSAQLSIEEYSRYITQDVEHPEAQVRVNCVLFPRALVNLVHNSASAIPRDRTPHIVLRSDCIDTWVRFQVADNGTGIPPQMQSRVWERGYSGRASSGLGLSFVRGVVERVGGHIDLSSAEGTGTTITLWIPKEGANYEPESE
jgi:signal transduction histidine kinase